jgi:ethanolamine utilization protein EutM
MQNDSLGLIETLGLVPAIEAADAGSKAANVVFRGYGRARAGLIIVVFAGDVAAVRAAVSAGSAAARRVGTVVSVHVIARPDRQVHVSSNGSRASQQGIDAPASKVEEEKDVANQLKPSFNPDHELVSAPHSEGLPATVVTLLDDKIMADVSAGNGYPALEEEVEVEVAVAVPAGRRKEKVRRTKSKRKS